VQLPPLRQRVEDIRLLAEYFLQKVATRMRLPRLKLSEDAMKVLEGHNWPGNVRELENTIQRACALSNSDVLLPSDIPLGSVAASRHANPATTVTRMRDALTTLIHVAQTSPDIELMPWMEKEIVRLAYRHFEENAPKTAKFLGLAVTDVQARLDPGGVKKASKKGTATDKVTKA